jgi:hypothetical protein
MASAPGWVWIGRTGWLGIYVLYPAWAIGLGLNLTRRATAGAPLATRPVDAEPAS